MGINDEDDPFIRGQTELYQDFKAGAHGAHLIVDGQIGRGMQAASLRTLSLSDPLSPATVLIPF